MLLAIGIRWPLRIPLATVFIFVGRRSTTRSYLEDELLCKRKGSNEALMGRKIVSGILRVAP
jgi:hypothetical protein